MNKNHENDVTHKSEINTTLAFTQSLCAILKTTILTMIKLLFGQQALWTGATFLLRVCVGVIFVRYGLSLFHDNNMLNFADTLKTANIPFPSLSA